MKKWLLLNASILGLITYYIHTRNEKEEDDLRRISSLETGFNKLDNYQRLYVSLLREYEKKKTSGYVSPIIDRFEERNIHTIIIYGCAQLGKLLADFLQNEPVKVKAFIDKYPRESRVCGDIPVHSIDSMNEIEKADCIIVTPVYIFDDIMRELYVKDRNEEILPITEFVK